MRGSALTYPRSTAAADFNKVELADFHSFSNGHPNFLAFSDTQTDKAIIITDSHHHSEVDTTTRVRHTLYHIDIQHFILHFWQQCIHYFNLFKGQTGLQCLTHGGNLTRFNQFTQSRFRYPLIAHSQPRFFL